MTDRELIELAAKAAGIDLMPEVDWNPLESDADAFRLAVKLRLVVTVGMFNVEARRWTGGDEHISCLCKTEAQLDDPYAAARRAITRAAAEIGKEMGK